MVNTEATSPVFVQLATNCSPDYERAQLTGN